MKLLGRKSGDKFVFGADAFGNEIECTITEVQSKYVRAFQETLKRFPKLFLPIVSCRESKHGMKNFATECFASSTLNREVSEARSLLRIKASDVRSIGKCASMLSH